MLYRDVGQMLKNITVENFKAFKTLNMEIKPITILIGPNNGGKSSILHAIEILKQTIESNTNDILNFNGDINFGDFGVIHHYNAKESFIRFKLEFEDATYFDTKIGLNSKHEVDILEYSSFNGKFGLKFEDINRISENYKFHFHYSFEDCDDLTPIDQLLQEGTLFRDNFFFVLNYSVTDRKKLQSLFLNTMKLVREIDSKRKKVSKDKADKALEIINSLLRLQTESTDFNNNIKTKLRNIHYIAPLRALAKRYYTRGNFSNVGYNGEYAVPIIADNKELFDKTNKILQLLEVTNDMAIEEKSADKKIISLKMKTVITDNVNFADVGCGTSQLLPIIVEYSLAGDDSLIIIEQPETHLHPKIQQEFTKFIVNDIIQGTNKGKKVIIETHSEYILEKIQTLLYDSKINKEQLAIYYVDQDPDMKASKIQRIEIDDDGTFSDYPPGYPLNFVINESEEQFKIMARKKAGKKNGRKHKSR